jgi:hypothetical protein
VNYFGAECQLFWSEVSIILIIVSVIYPSSFFLSLFLSLSLSLMHTIDNVKLCSGSLENLKKKKIIKFISLMQS